MKHQYSSTRNRLIKIAISVMVVAAILFSLHILVNYTDLVSLLRRLHSG